MPLHPEKTTTIVQSAISKYCREPLDERQLETIQQMAINPKMSPGDFAYWITVYHRLLYREGMYSFQLE
mgnify:CR=1 FL=1